MRKFGDHPHHRILIVGAAWPVCLWPEICARPGSPRIGTCRDPPIVCWGMLPGRVGLS
jgi:hypothetical protein